MNYCLLFGVPDMYQNYSNTGFWSFFFPFLFCLGQKALFILCKFGYQEFLEWKAARREELSDYQKQIGEQYLANVEKELERWQNARKARKANNDMMNLQETMDKELDTHRLEHGPKKRKIPDGSNNEDEDDVEDINVVEDDMMDDVLDVDDNSRMVDETAKSDAGNASPNADNID